MTYKDLLDFKNQFIVDRVYQTIKDKEDNEELEDAYHEITERNKTTIKSAHYQYQLIMERVNKILGIIGLICFAVLFVVVGSIILATFVYFLNMAIGDSLKWLYNWTTDFGMGVYNILFSSMAGVNAAQFIEINGTEVMQFFYIIGMSFCLIIIFTILYIASMFKKEKVQKEDVVNKNNIELTIEESYRILQVQEDDSWKSIQKSFQKKLVKKNKDFFDKYYHSYITIFKNYTSLSGSFQQLETSQKIMLCIHTFLNSSKNILGSFSKPIFFTAVATWAFYRTFSTSVKEFTLEFFVSQSSIGRAFYGFMKNCYDFVSQTFFQFVLPKDNLEISYFISFCIVISLVYIIFDIYKKKWHESVRQFYRRMNYYLKKNQGIYDEKKKYTKSYLYSIEFTAFVFILMAVYGVQMAEKYYDPTSFLPPEQREQAVVSKPIRDRMYKVIQEYADEKKHNLVKAQQIPDFYLLHDILKENEHQEYGYLKLIMLSSEEEATNEMTYYKEGANVPWKHHKKLDIDYYVSLDGFVIRDHNVIISMSNDENFRTPSCDLEPPQKKLTKKEINNFVIQLGYDLS